MQICRHAEKIKYKHPIKKQPLVWEIGEFISAYLPDFPFPEASLVLFCSAGDSIHFRQCIAAAVTGKAGISQPAPAVFRLSAVVFNINYLMF